MVLLKTLSAAVRDGDRIDAVIRGSAFNHNGRSTYPPSSAVQVGVISQALHRAGMESKDVDYIELAVSGDLSAGEDEMAALLEAFGNEGGDRLIPVGTVTKQYRASRGGIGHIPTD